MKTLLLTLLFGCGIGTTFGQRAEFPTFENGLIYPSETLLNLKKKATDINKKFERCEIQSFHSIPQTIGWVIDVKNEVKNSALNQCFSLDDLSDIAKFEIKNAIAIAEFKEENKIDYYSINPSHSEVAQLYGYKLINAKWLTYGRTDAKIEKLIYLPNAFQSTALPSTYAADISYADCMIDTSTSIFVKGAVNGQIDLPDNWRSYSHAQKKKLYDKFRSTIVYGMCSQDQSPRIHAMNIAVLAAELGDWEVFLKAHLNIMMDKVSRMSDNSGTWASRLTYIKELEQLNINLPNLLIGTILMADNLADGHYYGKLHRLGNAIIEAEELSTFIQKMEIGIQDEKLDLLNRVRLLALYESLTQKEKYRDDDELLRKLDFYKASILQSIPKKL